MTLQRPIGLSFKNSGEGRFLDPKPRLRHAGMESELHLCSPGIQ